MGRPASTAVGLLWVLATVAAQDPGLELVDNGDLHVNPAPGADVVLNGIKLSSLDSAVARQATDRERLDLALTKISNQADEIKALKADLAAVGVAQTKRDISAVQTQLKQLEDKLDALADSTGALPGCVANMVDELHHEAIEGCPAPSGTADKCAAYPDLVAGTVSGTGTGVGSVRVLHCDDDRRLTNTVAGGVVVCGADQEWSDSRLSRCVSTTTVTTATATTVTTLPGKIRYSHKFRAPGAGKDPDFDGWVAENVWSGFDLETGEINAKEAKMGGGKAIIQRCGPFEMLGGHGFFGKGTFVHQTFPTPRAHTMVQITFGFVRIGSWDAFKSGEPTWGEAAQLLVDGSPVFSRVLASQYRKIVDGTWTYGPNSPGSEMAPRDKEMEGRTGGIFCKNSKLEMRLDLSVLVAHTSDEMSLTFKTDVGSPAWDESWGLTDVAFAAVEPQTPVGFDKPGRQTHLDDFNVAGSRLGWVGAGMWTRPDPTRKPAEYIPSKAQPCLTKATGKSKFAGQSFLGGACFGKGTDIFKSFAVPATGLGGIIVTFTLFIIDSWDDETVTLTLNGDPIWSEKFNVKNWGDDPAYEDITGQTRWRDKVVEVTKVLRGFTEPRADFHFTTTLQNHRANGAFSGDPHDESWGLRRFRLTKFDE